MGRWGCIAGGFRAKLPAFPVLPVVNVIGFQS